MKESMEGTKEKTIEVSCLKKMKLILAGNPKVGDKVWSFDGGIIDSNRLPEEHILVKKINNEVFKSTRYSVIHVSNIFYEI